ncbi:hypothetical protein GH733_008069 [Mirounga leonina]|nr:hypothetical protein GH733_008069 [Mirounga leonina]
MEGKVPVAMPRSCELQKKLRTSKQSLQRSANNKDSIKLGSSKPKEIVPTLAPKALFVAAAVNGAEDSEAQEIPPEAKMSIKNIGWDTPPPAARTPFNKGTRGFSDNQKLWEQNIKFHLGNVHDQYN